MNYATTGVLPPLTTSLLTNLLSMSPDPPTADTNNPSETATEESTDSLKSVCRISPHPDVSDVEVSPINPTPSIDFMERLRGQQYADTHMGLQFVDETRIRSFDAFNSGWLVHSPARFTVESSEADNFPYSVTSRLGDAVLEVDQYDGGTVVIIDTLLDISFPEEYAVLLTEPQFIPQGTGVRTVFQRIDTDAQTPVKLRVIMELVGECTIGRNQPIAQMSPIPAADIGVSAEKAAEKERLKVMKEERRHSLYPETYDDQRNVPTTR